MNSLLVIAALGVITWLIWGRRAPKTGTRGAPTAANNSMQTTSAHHWKHDGSFDFAVVGESNYQSALQALTGNSPSAANDRTFTAVLLCEDDNVHDQLAVAVRIDGLKIGYLSRPDARSFRRRLAAKRLGKQATSCDAIITGGYVLGDGSRAKYGVQLDMRPFDL